MQTTHKIPGSSALRFARYLLAEAARGDRYYTHDGDQDAPTQWHGPEKLLRSFGIDPDKPVELKHLGPLMQGFDPLTKKPIRPAGSNGTRVAGIDLSYSPPKEVSALWATASPERRAQLEAAHRKAVKSTLQRIEREVALVRRNTNKVQSFEKAKALLATEVMHTTSRLGKDQDEHGIPDPQLHSHIVLLAAERKDGVLAAIESKQLYRSAREHGAWYRAELAANLQELGIGIERHQGNGERYFGVRGVSKELSQRWSTRSEDIDRAANLFRQRYGREPGPSELDSITLSTRGSKTAAPPEEVNAAWRALGEEHNQTAKRSEEAFHDWGLHNDPSVNLAEELLANVTRESSMINTHELHAKAYELSAGVCRPADADKLVSDLIRSGELLELEDGTWTTRRLRELEEATVAIADQRADEIAAPVSEQSLKRARREIGKQIKGSLNQEQRDALLLVTGPGGIAVLVGPAGTGKGVVISTAARAWQLEGIEVIGISVAGEVAQRLQWEARLDASYSADDLNYGIRQGRIHIGPNTVVIFDEAAMADHDRIAPLIKLTAERGAKPLLVGDAAQISSIGPGGLFAALEGRVPTAELKKVLRANHQWEREAWQQVRAGEPGPPLAAYHSHDRLHIHDTRAESAEAMVENWDETRKRFGGRAVMITDASNLERDQMNAMAQERRIAAGELGAHEVELPGKPYGLHAGDEIIFSAKFRVPGEDRIKNGVSATVIHTNRRENTITIRTNEHEPREVEVDTSKFDDLSLSYAAHVNKGQGITAETSGILIGGWQTHKENAYVTLTRSREETQIFLSREDLGEMGLDTGAMERLAEKMKRSRAQQATITKKLADRTQQRQHTVEREPRRKRTTDRTRPHQREIDDFLDPRREPPRDRPDDDDLIAPDRREQDYQDPSAEPTNERVQADARDRFEQHQHEPRNSPLNIQDADPADIQLDVRDLGDIKLTYTQQPYDLRSYTGEQTYTLFGGWQTETEQGFVAVTHSPQGTDVQISREDRSERDIETELRERVQQVIERGQSQQATNTRDADRENQREPSQLEAGARTPDQKLVIEPLEHDPNDPPAIEPSERTPDHQPEREPVDRNRQLKPDRQPVERDPYIQEAIDRERDRQQAFEQGIEQERQNDRGFGIE